MNTPKRARRIQDKERMKKRAIRARETSPNPEQAKKVADHMKSCSCMMCRNPRRTPYHERTRQEEENDLSFKEQVDQAVPEPECTECGRDVSQGAKFTVWQDLCDHCNDNS